MKDTAAFIRLVVQLWKLLNCKDLFMEKRYNDADACAIKSEDCAGIRLLKKWAEHGTLPSPRYAKAIPPAQPVRMQTLTNDTSNALIWTVQSLAGLSKYLLNTDKAYKHDYVLLGFFQQDCLESHFGYFRQSHGGNYFISAAQVLATHQIDRAQNILRYCKDIDLTEVEASKKKHACKDCDKPLTEVEIFLIDETIDSLAVYGFDNLGIDKDTLLCLCYIGGYLAHKHDQYEGHMKDLQEENDNPLLTAFIEQMSRGKLKYPSPELYKFLVLAYYFFISSEESMCRNRLVSVLKDFPKTFTIDIELESNMLTRIANIFFKRFSYRANALMNEANLSEASKLAKLSSSSIVH